VTFLVLLSGRRRCLLLRSSLGGAGGLLGFVGRHNLKKRKRKEKKRKEKRKERKGKEKNN